MPTEQTLSTLEATYAELSASPSDAGTIDLIVARPKTGERETLNSAEIHTDVGMVGDNWQARPSRHTDDGSASIECQITLMNSKILTAIEADKSRWALAGDNFIVDFDLSEANLPAGQRIQMGSVILEVSAIPHTGCGRFSDRFGSAAIRFVNSPEGRALRRRGVNCKVIQSGTVNLSDTITKLN